MADRGELVMGRESVTGLKPTTRRARWEPAAQCLRMLGCNGRRPRGAFTTALIELPNTAANARVRTL